MKTKILIVEHDSIDIDLVRRELSKGGIPFISENVQHEAGYRAAIDRFLPDIILSGITLATMAGAICATVAARPVRPAADRPGVGTTRRVVGQPFRCAFPLVSVGYHPFLAITQQRLADSALLVTQWAKGGVWNVFVARGAGGAG